MVHAVAAWASDVWGTLKPLLHDPEPTDLAISACFVAAIAVLSVVCCRPRVPWGDRMRWLGVLMLLGALLLNQQGDLHNAALRAAKRAARGIGSEVGDPLLQMLRPASFVIVVIVLAGTILVFATRERPPGPVAGAGLLLLLVHAAGRGATFIGLIDQPFGQGPLHQALEVTEVLGLAMIAVAAVRYRPPLSATIPGRRSAAVA